ncbi:MAG: terpene cyclase/mutase family protein, partial [Planctomycetota bacterium]|nr:terpene cyclase/mutase family protein [Planctomycetota bacterium]
SAEHSNPDHCWASQQWHPEAVVNGVEWLLNLQNRDGGFPTFCRGWGTLPFDRSSPDITAHCLRALAAWLVGANRRRFDFALWKKWALTSGVAEMQNFTAELEFGETNEEGSFNRADGQMRGAVRSIVAALLFLTKQQRSNGSWVPLWFGNQFAENDENPVYGTSRVLMAYRDLGMLDAPEAQRAAEWLASVQEPEKENPSTLDPRLSTPRGWGGDAGIEPSVEETALAAEVLLEFEPYRKNAFDGISWLIDKVGDGSVSVPTPIGFYFARLWYFERLYPLIFAVSALRRAVEISEESPA